jgi:hypothetical protein
MGLFTNKGKDAVTSANKQNVDLSKVYIRLKENESVRVRLLGAYDFVEYMAHGDFNLGIFTTACINGVIGEEDAYCVASKSGIEGFDRLYPKKRYLFVMADIDTGEIRVWDASKTQGKALMTQIKFFEESLDDVAFSFGRTGTKIETKYSLNPILKLNPADKEKFDAFNGTVIEDAFYESVLIPKTQEQQIEALKQAGFPVDEFFGVAKEEEKSEVNPTEGF